MWAMPFYGMGPELNIKEGEEAEYKHTEIGKRKDYFPAIFPRFREHVGGEVKLTIAGHGRREEQKYFLDRRGTH